MIQRKAKVILVTILENKNFNFVKELTNTLI